MIRLGFQVLTRDSAGSQVLTRDTSRPFNITTNSQNRIHYDRSPMTVGGGGGGVWCGVVAGCGWVL